MELKPIGVIRTPFSDPSATPLQSLCTPSEGKIELEQGYSEGLQNLAEFSHAFLIYLFHKAPLELLVEKPLTGEGPVHGIFSTRHVNRPNRIGLSVVFLSEVNDHTIRFTGADMLDGSLLLDIKPYIPAFDSVPDASSGWVDQAHLEQIRKRSHSNPTVK